eukprot:6421272-Amphidinium_carterae.1
MGLRAVCMRCTPFLVPEHQAMSIDESGQPVSDNQPNGEAGLSSQRPTESMNRLYLHVLVPYMPGVLSNHVPASAILVRTAPKRPAGQT